MNVKDFSTENFGKSSKSKIASKIVQNIGKRDIIGRLLIFQHISKLISATHLNIHHCQNHFVLLILMGPHGTVRNQKDKDP